MTTPQVGQTVQYFDRTGAGPFAAIVLGTADTYDAAKAPWAQRVPEEDEVTLEVVRPKGRRYVREFVPREDSPQHAKAAGFATPDEGDHESAEDTTDSTSKGNARFWRPLA